MDHLRGDVTQYLERITVAVLGQELLTHSALEMALMPILQGTWEEDWWRSGDSWGWLVGGRKPWW